MRWQNYLFVFFTLVISLTITKNIQAQTSSIIEEIVVTSTLLAFETDHCLYTTSTIMLSIQHYSDEV